MPGEAIPYIHDQWEPVSDAASMESVLARAQGQGPEGDIVVPAIPALDVCRKRDPRGPDEDSAVDAFAVAQWPESMRQPMMKKREGEGGAVKGVDRAFASGARSCVVKVGDSWCVDHTQSPKKNLNLLQMFAKL